MLLQTDEVMMACDVHHAAAHIIELTLPTLVQAKRVDTAQTDDF
jgi:PTS system mannose-specific IIA component